MHEKALVLRAAYLEIVVHGMSDEDAIFENVRDLLLDFLEGFR